MAPNGTNHRPASPDGRLSDITSPVLKRRLLSIAEQYEREAGLVRRSRAAVAESGAAIRKADAALRRHDASFAGRFGGNRTQSPLKA
jgi:hypothetical protein